MKKPPRIRGKRARLPAPTASEGRKPDRRVLRSRSALFSAAVRLVSERETTAISVTELADAANVSRQLVYLQFGDLDALLIAAAVDLVTRELIPKLEGAGPEVRSLILATTRHFGQHRSFYRAMLTGSCAFAMARTMSASFGALTRQAARGHFGSLDSRTEGDLAVLLAAGVNAIVNNWLIDGAEPLVPEELAERLTRVSAVLARSRGRGNRG